MNTSSIFHKPAKLLVAGSLLFAALLAGQTAFAQNIVGSKHDLSSSGPNASIKSSTTAEVCVFCHTPHGANSAAPLWNRGTGTTAGFTYYTKSTSPSMDSPDATAATIGLQSAMCLSCHDGSTALNLLINNPGSGAGTAPSMAAANMSALYGSLGKDLSNDHPIGIQYCGGVIGTGNGCVDKDFKLTTLIKKTGAAAGAVVTTFAAGAASDRWWLDIAAGGTALIRDKTDLPLYADATFVPTVQCATCHEPHNNNGGGAVVSFLRTSNAASVMCTTCHNK